jgi:hypothetical protein
VIAWKAGSKSMQSLSVPRSTGGNGSDSTSPDSSNDTTRVSQSSRDKDGAQLIDERVKNSVISLHSDSPVPKKQFLGNVAIARDIVDNKYCVVLTTLLTLYALTGDDIRVLSTDKPYDIVFLCFVITCLIVFTLEVILSCLGKAEYFLGFFFWLDCLSTASLILDIPAVSEQILNLGSGSDDNAGNVRSGKAAVLGARVGRVVRVLRLVRIIKLYKAMETAREKAAQEKRKKSKLAKALEPGQDDDFWSEEDVKDEANNASTQETRVGKKTLRDDNATSHPPHLGYDAGAPSHAGRGGQPDCFFCQLRCGSRVALLPSQAGFPGIFE